MLHTVKLRTCHSSTSCEGRVVLVWCEWEEVRREERDVSSSTTSATPTTSFVVSSVGVSFSSLARNVFLLLAFLLITEGLFCFLANRAVVSTLVTTEKDNIILCASTS